MKIKKEYWIIAIAGIILIIIAFVCGFFIGKKINENEERSETKNGENSYELSEYDETQNDYKDTYNVTQNSLQEFNHVDDVSKILDDPGGDSALKNRKEEIVKDELDYGENYEKFTNFELYARKPDRIIFKQGNKDGFFLFEKDDKAYEHLLVVSEDRMAYSVMQDFNLWCFTPDSIDKMTTSGENYIIYDFDNQEDEEFQKDIIFRFNSNNRLYRLVSYLTEFKEPVARENLGKSEFAENTEISGYKYMTQYEN